MLAPRRITNRCRTKSSLKRDPKTSTDYLVSSRASSPKCSGQTDFGEARAIHPLLVAFRIWPGRVGHNTPLHSWPFAKGVPDHFHLFPPISPIDPHRPTPTHTDPHRPTGLNHFCCVPPISTPQTIALRRTCRLGALSGLRLLDTHSHGAAAFWPSGPGG